jgi:hypothetical protein
MTEALPGAVECYSGHTYAQEPRAFAWEGERQAVAEVVDRWRSPAGPAFRVRTGNGQLFDLYYDQAEDLWYIRPMSGPDSGDVAEDKTKEV